MKAIITGASSGIGKEFALILAKKGYNLIIAARREDRLQELKKQIEKRHHVQVTVCPADLSLPENAARFADRWLAEPVEILINNAGFGKVGNFSDTSLESDLPMIQTNITSLHILMKKFIQTQQHGYILNVASIAAHLPGPGLATYSATKAYVLSLSQAVGLELKEAGIPISVTALCPGPVRTEFFQVAGADNELPSVSPRHCAMAGIHAMFEKKPVAFSDLRTALLQKAIRLIPTSVAMKADYEIQKTKLQKESSID